MVSHAPGTSNRETKPTSFASFQRALLKWYDAGNRDMPWRKTSDPYQIWVSEIMLQQTRVNAVIPYFNRFIARFPAVDALASAPQHDVLKLWEGLGYYARARNLHRAAMIVCEQHNRIVPKDPIAFAALPGCGPYITAAVQSIAYGAPLAAVDGNVKRVLSRLLENSTSVNATTAHRVFFEFAQERLPLKRPGDYNQAMMELGAMICTPRNPQCARCPLSSHCKAFQNNTMAKFPLREKKKKVPTKHIAVGVVEKHGKLLITRRAQEGLLGGLWEFPGGGIEKGETAADACVRELKEETNLTVSVERHLTTVKHAYTHFKIVMEVFICRVESGKVALHGPVDYKWVTVDELSLYPFPTANNKFIPMLG